MEKYNCLKCGHKWKRRNKCFPKICPLCKTKLWNKPKAQDLVNLLIK